TSLGDCCALCPQGYGVAVPCGSSNTECDHYLHVENGSSSQCLPCQVCGQGYGAAMPCGPMDNTVCQRCPEGFYSEEKSDSAPCLPCRLECHEDEVMIRKERKKERKEREKFHYEFQMKQKNPVPLPGLGSVEGKSP
uniref:TNFR-Cys domain-containing protein n=1 Tax=Chelonoidis abingdonii TaxID=106734 RepID=A0A8C0JCT5_CHEAB